MKHRSVHCLNCGKHGHFTRECRAPINSYGCVVFKKDATHSLRYLMIQRKYTPEYIELLRGRYYLNNELDYQYLVLLIMDTSMIERDYILQHDFEYLWTHVWQWIGTSEQMQRIQRDYRDCRDKFERLKNGDHFQQHGFLSFQSLFQKITTHKIEPDWEFPKGKRRMNESDQQCAIRECCEETSLQAKDFDLQYHIVPFKENFTGVNRINYCNTYYLAMLTTDPKPLYYDPSHHEQNKEIRKIGWFSVEEINQIVHNVLYRLKMIREIHRALSQDRTFPRNSPHQVTRWIHHKVVTP